MEELVGKDRFKIYTGPEVVNFDGTDIVFMPWINANNYDESINVIRYCSCSYCVWVI